jgi:hypothetical protein
VRLRGRNKTERRKTPIKIKLEGENVQEDNENMKVKRGDKKNVD